MPAPGPTQPPIQCVPGALSLEVKLPIHVYLVPRVRWMSYAFIPPYALIYLHMYTSYTFNTCNVLHRLHHQVISINISAYFCLFCCWNLTSCSIFPSFVPQFLCTTLIQIYMLEKNNLSSKNFNVLRLFLPHFYIHNYAKARITWRISHERSFFELGVQLVSRC